MTEVEWGFTPETNKDKGFEPFKGIYIARIDKLERKQGTSEKSGKPYDFYSATVQVVKKVKGDDANKRLLFQSYDPDGAGIKKLADDLFTAGISVDTSSEKTFEASLEGAIDKLITVKAWDKARVKKEGEEWVQVVPKEMVQRWSIPKKQEDASGVEETSDMPF